MWLSPMAYLPFIYVLFPLATLPTAFLTGIFAFSL
jgi:hypothetical protein